MFCGCQTISLDAQNRMAVPVRFRKIIARESENRLVVTRGIESSRLFLTLYTLKKWQEIEETVKTLPSANPVSQQIRRLLIGSACELELDTNHRILLPATLRGYMCLHKKAVMIGVGEVIELWDEEQWSACEQSYNQNPIDFAQLPDVFQNLNFN